MIVRSVPLAEISVINPPTPTDVGDEIAFVPMASVSTDGFMTVAEHRDPTSLSGGFSYFRNGDVLVAKITPCYENNKIALATIDRPHGFGSTEFHVIRADVKQLDAKYLLHFLRQDRVRGMGKQRMTGSAGQRRVPKQFLAGLEIPLPSLDEQRQIAVILDLADALRNKRKQTVAKIGTLVRAAFICLFGNPISNARSWPLANLSDVGILERGISKHRPRNDPKLLGGRYPLVQTGDIANANGYVRTYSATYSEDGLRQSRLWPRGTLCITIAANIGKTAVLTFDACFPDSIVGFTAGPRIRSEFVQTWMSFIQKSLEDDAPQFAQKNINLAILRALQIPVPPLELQDKFKSIVSLVEAENVKADKSRNEFSNLFHLLQQRAFRGGLLPSRMELSGTVP